MGVLSRDRIMALASSEKLEIRPFDEKKVEPASYDLSLGSILQAGVGRVNIVENQDFILQSNSWACVS